MYYKFAARICSDHFDAECFIMKLTKPRSKNIPAKELRRLKKDAIPCRMLAVNTERGRKKTSDKETICESKQIKATNVP